VRRFVRSCLALALCAGTARADVIFQNNTDFHQPSGNINYVPFVDDGTPNRPAGNHLGETITFAGTARLLNSVVLGIENVGPTTNTYTLALYSGANPNTGTLLGSVNLVVGPVFAGMETFNFGSLLVPDTITFVLSSSFTGAGFPDGPVSSNIAPTVGSGPDSLWYGNSPGNFVANNTWAIADGAVVNYLVAQFNASSPVATVPEPGSLALAGFGLMGLVGYRLRRRTAA
jgi:hypothetical protein